MCPVYDTDEIRIRSYPQTYHTRDEISLDLHLSESEEENESQQMKNDTSEKQAIVDVLDEFVENNPVGLTVKDNACYKVGSCGRLLQTSC